jgi:hypothetical protein
MDFFGLEIELAEGAAFIVHSPLADEISIGFSGYTL